MVFIIPGLNVVPVANELPLLSYQVHDGVPTPPVAVTSKSGFISPPSHMFCDCNIDVIVGSGSMVMVMVLDVMLLHPFEEKVSTQLYK